MLEYSQRIRDMARKLLEKGREVAELMNNY